MKKYYKKSSLLLLLLCGGIMVMAQSLNYKSLTRELQVLQKQLVPDKRVAILTLELKDTLQRVIALSGEANSIENKSRIIHFLKDKKISFTDSLRLLPDSSLGDKTWALGSNSVANMRAQPDHASELVSQILMGTPMKVLDVKDNWFRVQTSEYYIGWVDSGGIHRLNAQEMENWKKSTRYLFNRLSGFVYEAPSTQAKTVSDLVLGDLFESGTEVRDFLKIKMPDHRTGYVRKADCISFDQWSRIIPSAQAIITEARKMMGFPYLWGGISSKAMDCSGLVKLVFYSQGMVLARDASQQAKYGVPLDFTNPANLQPGDLLFFGASALKITHVGIYQGNGKFIHSSGKVGIGSIIPGDPEYNPKRKIVAACRVINSSNADGIELIKNHPWYSTPK